MKSIREKPEFSFTINSGAYVVEPSCFDLIPNEGVFHMTDLIDLLINEHKSVYAYPINENEYIDIGQWDEYKSAVSKMGG